MTSSTTSFRSAAPVGYGFHPSDEELVNHFLRLKMGGGSDHLVSTIAEVNVCDFEPWELPGTCQHMCMHVCSIFFLICDLLRNNDCVGKSAIQSDDPECYFFSPRNYKYAKSQRANRTTKAGYWKGTGKDRTVTESTGKQIATKRTLVFYSGRVPNGVKTNWIMHEYNPTFDFPNKVCQLALFQSNFLGFTFLRSFDKKLIDISSSFDQIIHPAFCSLVAAVFLIHRNAATNFFLVNFVQRDFILYKLKKSPDDTPAFDGGESSTSIVTEVRNSTNYRQFLISNCFLIISISRT